MPHAPVGAKKGNNKKVEGNTESDMKNLYE
jgi:hypothetical protein